MATNTTSTPLVIGKGRLFFATCPPGEDIRTINNFEFIGNVPGINITFETETLTHFDSTGGIQRQDDSVDLRVTSTGGFNTDAITAENLARFLFGESSVVTQVGSSVTDESITPRIPNAYLQLGRSLTNPTGARGVSNVVVSDAAGGGGTTFTEGTDYEVDAQTGVIEILSDSTIAVDTELFVSYDVDTQTRDRVISGRNIAEGALQFVEDNVRGENKIWLFPRTIVRPDGDFTLISDEFQSIPFQLELLLAGDLERVYLDGQPFSV